VKKLDLWSAIFWLMVGGFISIHSYRLGLGSLRNPGAGFLFFWGGIFLGILSISIIVSSIASRKEDHPKSSLQVFENINWKKVTAVLTSLILYGLLFERLGYLISTFLLFAFLLYSIETKRWFVVFFVAFLSSSLSYLLFSVWLQVRLPKGIFGI